MALLLLYTVLDFATSVFVHSNCLKISNLILSSHYRIVSPHSTVYARKMLCIGCIVNLPLWYCLILPLNWNYFPSYLINNLAEDWNHNCQITSFFFFFYSPPPPQLSYVSWRTVQWWNLISFNWNDFSTSCSVIRCWNFLVLSPN